MEKTGLVPAQRKGTSTGASVNRKATTRHEAILLYKAAKSRLMDINNWGKLSGKDNDAFRLMNEKGEYLLHTLPEAGQYIRIKIPGPGNEEGDGYDWVRIERIEDQQDMLKDFEMFGFRVRPAANPLHPSDTTAHFYKDSASSTFMVLRSKSIITAAEKGRNELPSSDTEGMVNKVRNFIVALSAMFGMAKSQWKSLMTGILYGEPAK